MASVLLVVASSSLATVRLYRAGFLDVRAVAMVAIVTAPAGLLGAFGTSQLPRDVFQAGFAVLIALIAVYLIWRPTGDAGSLGRRGWRACSAIATATAISTGFPSARTLLATGVTATFTALAGIGGGPFFSLIAVRIMRMPVWLAIPASHGIVATIAVVVVIFHTASSNWGEPLRDVPPLLIGAIIANPIGLRLRRHRQRAGADPAARRGDDRGRGLHRDPGLLTRYSSPTGSISSTHPRGSSSDRSSEPGSVPRSTICRRCWPRRRDGHASDGPMICGGAASSRAARRSSITRRRPSGPPRPRCGRCT